MSHLDAQPVLTKSFERAILGINAAIARKMIVGIVSPAGVGFKFALQQVAKKHYLRIIVCDISYAPSFGNVMLSVHRQLCKVKFSRLDYENVSLHKITTLINERVKTNDINLLVLDNCGNLTLSQLRYFIRFLMRFNRHLGLVFRMNTQYVKRMKGKWEKEYVDLYKVVDDWGVLKSPEDDEIIEICKSHGIQDEMIISDLVRASGKNLSILKKHITRYFEVVGNSQQF